ncbi:MAG: hypothetical protein AB1586_30420, partial [Pseudomonadota bacterium]
ARDKNPSLFNAAASKTTLSFDNRGAVKSLSLSLFSRCVNLVGLDPAIQLARSNTRTLKLDHRVAALARRPGDND